MNAVSIKITNLHTNTGQIPGVPANPRFIKDEPYEKLKKSIQDDPEMLDLRELIVYPYPGKKGHYVIIGGNMRYRICNDNAIVIYLFTTILQRKLDKRAENIKGKGFDKRPENINRKGSLRRS
jgi:hypothetical protein